MVMSFGTVSVLRIGKSGFRAGVRAALRVTGPAENPDINYGFLNFNLKIRIPGPSRFSG